MCFRLNDYTRGMREKNEKRTIRTDVRKESRSDIV